MLHCLATGALLSLTPVALPAGMDEESSELEKICEAARVAVEKAVEAEQTDSEEEGEASDSSEEPGEGELGRYCCTTKHFVGKALLLSMG